MTLEEAMARFIEAANNAIYDNTAVAQAWADLKACGVINGTLEIRADLRLSEAAPKNDDKNFLRQLRITPDLEVRE